MAKRMIYFLLTMIMAEMAFGVFKLRYQKENKEKRNKAVAGRVRFDHRKYDIMQILKKSNAELMAIRGLLLKVAHLQDGDSRKDSMGVLGEDVIGEYKRDINDETRVYDQFGNMKTEDSKKELVGNRI